jgi:hypothetical protein
VDHVLLVAVPLPLPRRLLHIGRVLLQRLTHKVLVDLFLDLFAGVEGLLQIDHMPHLLQHIVENSLLQEVLALWGYDLGLSK